MRLAPSPGQPGRRPGSSRRPAPRRCRAWLPAGALIRETRESADEHPVAAPRPPSTVQLAPAQADAASRILAVLDRPDPGVFLLHGVTGSGKTEVYFRLIDAVLARGLQAVVLVPEISMTPQTLARLRARYGDAVAVVHSALGETERHSEWLRIRSGEASIVVGARSALLAPVFALGLIIVDEEHESSYKQESGVRYHARDVAIELGRLASVPVVLGSATPDVVTYQRALTGAYTLLTLPERYLPAPANGSARIGDDAGLPEVEVVDLRSELGEGNTSIFSARLRSAVENALARGEQAILFLNRRGASTFIMCRDCGLVMTCKRCDSSLVYHSAGESLVCHLCNRRTPVPRICPGCGSQRIRYFGIGTQRVETEARAAFPDARIIRYDRDTVRTRNAHEAVYTAFNEHQADILIGTQMIAKGFDYPLVTVVGIISADQSLHLPDFRSPERAFQLLTQVSGRAGRRERPGLAIIQTYSPSTTRFRPRAGTTTRRSRRKSWGTASACGPRLSQGWRGCSGPTGRRSGSPLRGRRSPRRFDSRSIRRATRTSRSWGRQPAFRSAGQRHLLLAGDRAGGRPLAAAPARRAEAAAALASGRRPAVDALMRRWSASAPRRGFARSSGRAPGRGCRGHAGRR